MNKLKKKSITLNQIFAGQREHLKDRLFQFKVAKWQVDNNRVDLFSLLGDAYFRFESEMSNLYIPDMIQVLQSVKMFSSNLNRIKRFDSLQSENHVEYTCY
jgi:hypothetical protein